ncbi:MAG: DUF222 domain-containing protein [Gemmatimonadota bacterium]
MQPRAMAVMEATLDAGCRDEDTELEAMGDEIVRRAAHMAAYSQEYLALVATFDRRRGWEPSGHRSCADWLAFRAGLDPNTAREHVRVARALEDLPRTRESMARGRLSFSQARALTRVATPEQEEDLLALAEGVPTSTLERMVRAWKKGSRQDEAARERELHRLRRFSVVPDDDGSYRVRGRLTPEVAAVLMRAVEAASDALYAEEEPDPEASPRQRRREAARRRHDALGLVAERGLAAGFSGEEVPVSGSRAERYQVLLHVDRDTLSGEGEPGRSELEDGTRVSAETSRRLSCDAGLVGVLRGKQGEVLDVGRKRRTVPPALRRALEVRDRGCRFPGCGLRFTDAHHITHWADGGETSLENCVLLCRRHHRLVHEEGWTVEWWGENRAVFRDPKGGVHLEERPDPPELAEDPAARVEAENRLRGADPGPLAASARWSGERDVPEEVWFAALEAGFAAVDSRADGRGEGTGGPDGARDPP